MQTTTGVQAFIGLEQEFFFVPRDAYYKRPDLQLSGRTVMGNMPPRNQEVCDHCKCRAVFHCAPCDSHHAVPVILHLQAFEETCDALTLILFSPKLTFACPLTVLIYNRHGATFRHLCSSEVHGGDPGAVLQDGHPTQNQVSTVP